MKMFNIINIISAFKEFRCPISIDTDVNAAGLAEARQGSAKNVGGSLIWHYWNWYWLRCDNRREVLLRPF